MQLITPWLCPGRCSVHLVGGLFCWWIWAAWDLAGAERPGADGGTNRVVILEIGGTAEFQAAGQGVWQEAAVNQVLRVGDRFRTR